MDKNRVKQYISKVKVENDTLNRKLIAKVVGVTFDGRQKILAEVEKDTPVKFIRDRRNKYDFYAVEVHVELNGEWKQAGFLPNPMCKVVSKSIDQGLNYSASVFRRIGGMIREDTGEQLNYGLEVFVLPER